MSRGDIIAFPARGGEGAPAEAVYAELAAATNFSCKFLWPNNINNMSRNLAICFTF